LVRAKLPPAELVFHPQFDGLGQSLNERPGLIAARLDAFEGLKARSFDVALIDRIKVDKLELDWNEATASVWPLSAWRKRLVAKKLKAYRAATGAAPEVDLPLLREYKDSCTKVLENLDSLGLSPQLRGLVEKDVAALAPYLEPAKQLREAIELAGFSLDAVAKASRGSLETVVTTARRLYGPGKEVESLRAKLKENLAQLGLSAELQARVEKDTATLDAQIKSARTIREALTSLGVSATDRGEAVRFLAAAAGEMRRQVAAECRQSAKDFLDAWVEYTRVAIATPAATESMSVVADAAKCANDVLTRRTSLKQVVAWVAVRKRSERLGLSKFIEALQSGQLSPGQAAAAFQLAYARWWLGIGDGLNVSWHQQLLPKKLGTALTRLRTGGPENGYCVDAFVIAPNRKFNGETFKKVSIQQDVA
jgi:hypothetical protein